MSLGPLVLEPIFSERIWGATELPSPYPQPQPGKPIGEVWLTAMENRVSGGELAGRSLAELVQAHPKELGASDGAGFPLLMKILLPKDKLSLQVHPNDAEAQRQGEPRGKTECWYVLQAEPGAELAVGLREGVTLHDVRAAIADGSMELLMRMLPVKVGDMVFVDAGTVHAIGPDVVVLETQQYSDVTYRMFDYGRPRELHVEQGLAVTRLQTQAGLVSPLTFAEYTRLMACEYFAVDRFETSAQPLPLGFEGQMQVLFALGEGAVLTSADQELALPRGFAVVLPAEGVAYAVKGSVPVVRVLAP